MKVHNIVLSRMFQPVNQFVRNVLATTGPNWWGTSVDSTNEAEVVSKHHRRYFLVNSTLVPLEIQERKDELDTLALPTKNFAVSLALYALWLETRDGSLLVCVKSKEAYDSYQVGETVAVDYQIGRFNGELRLYANGSLKQFPYLI